MTQKTALITGAAQGIGEGIALRLASDGYDISINDIQANQALLIQVGKKIEDLGRKAFIAIGDVSSESDVQRIVKETVENLGGLDVMVANAGICIGKYFIDTTVDEWDRLFSTNARGTFLCYKYAAKHMIEQGRGGRIIGACSVSGVEGNAVLSAYGATKFAIRGLTQAVALELGRFGITVNAYAPGVITTTMTANTARSFGLSPEGLIAEEAKKAAVGHVGKPEDVAAIVSYFASDESRFTTGQTVVMNGGRK